MQDDEQTDEEQAEDLDRALETFEMLRANPELCVGYVEALDGIAARLARQVDQGHPGAEHLLEAIEALKLGAAEIEAVGEYVGRPPDPERARQRDRTLRLGTQRHRTRTFRAQLTQGRTGRTRERRTARPRRAAASSTTSGQDPGDGDSDPLLPRLAVAPPPRAIWTYGCLTADQRGEHRAVEPVR